MDARGFVLLDRVDGAPCTASAGGAWAFATLRDVGVCLLGHAPDPRWPSRPTAFAAAAGEHLEEDARFVQPGAGSMAEVPGLLTSRRREQLRWARYEQPQVRIAVAHVAEAIDVPALWQRVLRALPADQRRRLAPQALTAAIWSRLWELPPSAATTDALRDLERRLLDARG